MDIRILITENPVEVIAEMSIPSNVKIRLEDLKKLINYSVMKTLPDVIYNSDNWKKEYQNINYIRIIIPNKVIVVPKDVKYLTRARPFLFPNIANDLLLCVRAKIILSGNGIPFIFDEEP